MRYQLNPFNVVLFVIQCLLLFYKAKILSLYINLLSVDWDIKIKVFLTYFLNAIVT